MAISFSVEDKWEMLALHRALLSAKFSSEAPPELAGSPFLAAMAERAADAVVQLSGGPSENWSEWRRVENHPGELAFVRGRLSNCRAWTDWDSKKRREFVRLLLSPFQATEDTVLALLVHADAHHPAGSKPRFFVRRVLQGIRQRPQLYLGPTEHPFTSLCGYLEGYTAGYDAARPGGGVDEHLFNELVPHDFHRFVAAHFEDTSVSTGGWRHHIVRHAQDEQAAFDLFFALLDAYENHLPAD